MQKVVLATGNPGKVRELADLLADFGWTWSRKPIWAWNPPKKLA